MSNAFRITPQSSRSTPTPPPITTSSLDSVDREGNTSNNKNEVIEGIGWRYPASVKNTAATQNVDINNCSVIGWRPEMIVNPSAVQNFEEPLPPKRSGSAPSFAEEQQNEVVKNAENPFFNPLFFLFCSGFY